MISLAFSHITAEFHARRTMWHAGCNVSLADTGMSGSQSRQKLQGRVSQGNDIHDFGCHRRGFSTSIDVECRPGQPGEVRRIPKWL